MKTKINHTIIKHTLSMRVAFKINPRPDEPHKWLSNSNYSYYVDYDIKDVNAKTIFRMGINFIVERRIIGEQ